jgi:phosphoribosylformimino-5-aminoimidazole carboxamide ribotide isomerase
MRIIPAIDIKDRECVRLVQGKAENKTVYNSSPLLQARIWKEKGADLIHIVDLDGAFEGKPVNLDIVTGIMKHLNINIEIGGGIRNLDIIRQYHEKGINRIIIGTLAYYQPHLVAQACEMFPDKIIIGIDVVDKKVAIHGWKTVSDTDYLQFARKMSTYGVKEFIITDISKDGMLSGINFDLYKEATKHLNKPIIASGGVKSLDDIKKLKELEPSGLSGVIIGKALYEELFDLTEALKIVEE